MAFYKKKAKLYTIGFMKILALTKLRSKYLYMVTYCTYSYWICGRKSLRLIFNWYLPPIYVLLLSMGVSYKEESLKLAQCRMRISVVFEQFSDSLSLGPGFSYHGFSYYNPDISQRLQAFNRGAPRSQVDWTACDNEEPNLKYRINNKKSAR